MAVARPVLAAPLQTGIIQYFPQLLLQAVARHQIQLPLRVRLARLAVQVVVVHLALLAALELVDKEIMVVHQ